MTALAGSEQLHHEVHEDSHAPTHHCAVTDLANGQADAPAPVVLVAPPATIAFNLPLPSSLPAPQAIDLRLDPGRAPPA